MKSNIHRVPTPAMAIPVAKSSKKKVAPVGKKPINKPKK